MGAGLRIIYRKEMKGAKEDAKRSRKVGGAAAEDGGGSGAQAGAGLRIIYRKEMKGSKENAKRSNRLW